MVGGEPAAFERARPVLESLGKTIVHVGGHGAGQTVKAANQLMVAGIISLVGEAMVLLEASGVDGEQGLEVLAGGLAGNRILDRKSATMLSRDFRPGFRIDLHHKDMGIALASARSAGVSLPVTGLVSQLVASARASGHGSLDHSALLLVLEQMSGRQADG
jgi:2-hydroxy-3-oxopropionate reductase